MVINIPSLVLKFLSLVLVIIAAGLWASGGVDVRPKHRDEQTLIGGALWSQAQIPLGLVISMIVEEGLDIFVHGYFLFTGFLILAVTGVMLITVEGIKLKKKIPNRGSVTSISQISGALSRRDSFDKTYFVIGVLLLIGAVLNLTDFILNLV